MRMILISAIFPAILLMSGGQALSQDTGRSLADVISFPIIMEQSAVAFETYSQTDPPDNVLLNAYKVASGYLAGIPFHYERSREKCIITWQIEEVPDDLSYEGYERVQGSLQFNFQFTMPSEIKNQVTGGESYEVKGSDGDDSLALARAYAINDALSEAVNSFLYSHYTENNETIPGIVDGRIAWHEITDERRDPISGEYVVELKAWVTVDGE
ncbi:MAG TPA: hypothetical protein VGB30_04865 [bacterium]